MYTILTGKYDADVTPSKVIRVYGSTTRGNVFKLDQGRAKYDLRNRVVNAWNSLSDHVVLYYLKLLTLLNRELINFGNINMVYDFQAELAWPCKIFTFHPLTLETLRLTVYHRSCDQSSAIFKII